MYSDIILLNCRKCNNKTTNLDTIHCLMEFYMPAVTLGAGTITGFLCTQTAYSLEATLIDNTTITWDTTAAQVAKVTLSGNRIIDAPLNLKTGAFYALLVQQDEVGSRVLGWNSVFKFAYSTAPTLSTSANARDFFVFRSDGTNLYEQGRSLGVA